jgi:hypothetical protein
MGRGKRRARNAEVLLAPCQSLFQHIPDNSAEYHCLYFRHHRQAARASLPNLSRIRAIAEYSYSPITGATNQVQHHLPLHMSLSNAMCLQHVQPRAELTQEEWWSWG